MLIGSTFCSSDVMSNSAIIRGMAMLGWKEPKPKLMTRSVVIATTIDFLNYRTLLEPSMVITKGAANYRCGQLYGLSGSLISQVISTSCVTLRVLDRIPWRASIPRLLFSSSRISSSVCICSGPYTLFEAAFALPWELKLRQPKTSVDAGQMTLTLLFK